ncbi:MAG: histidine kinase N-terminal 7TM domain-containing protein [Actinomycetota bacterium]
MRLTISATRLVWAVPFVCALATALVAAYILGLGPQPVAGIGDEAIFTMVTGLAFGCVGALVSARQPGNAIGWLFCAVGLATALSGPSFIYGQLAVPGRAWGTWLSNWTGLFTLVTVPLVLLLFPDGKPLSRRWRLAVWVAGVAMAILEVHNAFAPGRLEDSTVANPAGIESLTFLNSTWLGWGAWLLVGVSVVAGAVSLVLRFRRSRGVQRQQLKWLALAAAMVGLGFVFLVATAGKAEWAGAFTGISILLLPVLVGVAILRYRLYDIDSIVNRTLVYGSVSAVMALVYVVGVVVVGDVIRGITGQNSNQLAVAASTLAVAALFRPARSRLQNLIDRRFYRRKYDATLTVKAFSTRLQEEIDLEALAAELEAVVRHTMQPASVSIWLRP